MLVAATVENLDVLVRLRCCRFRIGIELVPAPDPVALYPVIFVALEILDHL